MKLTILVDNVTYNPDLQAEDGYSAFIEDGECRVLLDTGGTDLFMRNAELLGLDLLKTDYIVLSHGHHDHVWGLKYLLHKYQDNPEFKAQLITHPLTMLPKTVAGRGHIGFDLTLDQISTLQAKFSREPFWLTERLAYLGETKRIHDFEGNYAIGEVHLPEGKQPDYIYDDTSLAYKAKDGLVVITGCAHSGIGNIIEQAKLVCNEQRILCVIGGTHMRKPTPRLLDATIDYLDSQNIKQLYCCHCTDIPSRIAMGRKLDNLVQGMVGTVLEIE